MPPAGRRIPCDGAEWPAVGRRAGPAAVGSRGGMMATMRDVIVAANWKMNTTPADAGELARTIASRTAEPGVVRVICPPFVCLAAVRDAVVGEGIAVGAQNIHHELAGAYTGEVSAPMLAGLATWVILGHSERRRDVAESDALIGRKLGRAVDAGLRPILCVGEQLAEREAGRAQDVVASQLTGALAGHDPDALLAAGIVIAYEPVWAIGTGRTASGADAAAMADAIRATLRSERLGPARGRGPGPLRRIVHEREHRRVPGRARHRRRARRRRVAQARRDGRHGRPGGAHAPRPRRAAPDLPRQRSRPMPTLVLLRHGESTWNKENRFTGWTDVDLSDTGLDEAHEAGRLLRAESFRFDVAHTSVLKRAIRTLWIALDELDQMWCPVRNSWRLNERHYGALQGLNKAEMAVKFGEAQVKLWRRSYDVPPPALTDDDERFPGHDPRYADLAGRRHAARRVAQGHRRAVPAVLGVGRSHRTCGRASACSWRPTATACGPSSSTSTASPTRRSSGSTSRPACRSSTTSTTTSGRRARATSATPSRVAAAMAAVAAQGAAKPAG